MKIWAIVASVLAVVFIGTSGWFYSQDSKHKNDLSASQSALTTAEKNVATAKAAQAASEKKIAAANKKAKIITIFMSGQMNQDSSLEAYSLIKEINDPTLTADWQSMHNSKPGDNSGNKMMADLFAGITNDLK
jgi:hypothetical protein